MINPIIGTCVIIIQILRIKLLFELDVNVKAPTTSNLFLWGLFFQKGESSFNVFKVMLKKMLRLNKDIFIY